jgi:hypothetical protein
MLRPKGLWQRQNFDGTGALILLDLSHFSPVRPVESRRGTRPNQCDENLTLHTSL